MTPLSTATYQGDFQNLSGRLSFLKITLKNESPINYHTRWSGVLYAGDNLYKGVRYNIRKVASQDSNLDWKSAGFRNFSETFVDENGVTKHYHSFESLDDKFTGVIPNSHSFIADDGVDANPYRTTSISIPIPALAPGEALENSTTYTISKIGGAVADNDFAGQFASVDAGDTIEVGYSFTTASTGETTAFDASEFDSGTRIVKGSELTVIEYGGTVYEKGKLIPNNGIQFVLEKLATFATIAQVGPLPDPLPDNRNVAFVVVLENSQYDVNNAEHIKIIRDKLNGIVDDHFKLLDSTYSRGSENDDFLVEEFILRP